MSEPNPRQRAHIFRIGTSHQDRDGQWHLADWGMNGGDFPGIDKKDGHPPIGGWWPWELEIIQRAREAWGDEVAFDLAKRQR